MRGISRMIAPLAASVMVVTGFVAGFGPGAASSAGASPATLSPASCNRPIEYSEKPEVDPKDKSIIVGITECDAVKKGTTPVIIDKTCVEVYNTGLKGWVIGAYPGQARGTACNNHRDGKYRYGITKRYVSYDQYRVDVVLTYEGVEHHIYSKVAVIHTS